MSFWSYSKLEEKRCKNRKGIQKRYLDILNLFKVASGDDSVFEIGYSNIIEDMVNYVIWANEKYIESKRNADQKANISSIQDDYFKKIESAYFSGDESEAQRLTDEMNKQLAKVAPLRDKLHSDEEFFKNEIIPVKVFRFSGKEAGSIFSKRFIEVLKRNLEIHDFDSIQFTLDVELEKPGGPNDEKGHISPGKFPVRFIDNNFYLGRIFIRLNVSSIKFESILDTLTHELKHLMQNAGGLTPGILEQTNIPFGSPSKNIVYDEKETSFDQELGFALNEEKLRQSGFFSENKIKELIGNEKKRYDELTKLYEKSNSDKRIVKKRAPIVIKLDNFNLAIEDNGLIDISRKKDSDDPFVEEDIKQVKKFFGYNNTNLNTGLEVASHALIPAEFFTNLSGKVIKFRRDIYELLLVARKIVEKEADKDKRKIALLEKIYNNYGTPDVRRYISNLPYMSSLEDPFASNVKGTGAGVKSINTHISSAISQYAADMLKSEMLNFDDFKKRLNVIENENLRNQVWKSFSKQADELSKKELSKILGAARSDAEEIINILEGGDLSERSFFKYFENNKGNA